MELLAWFGANSKRGPALKGIEQFSNESRKGGSRLSNRLWAGCEQHRMVTLA